MTNPVQLRDSLLANPQLSADEQAALVAVLDRAVVRYGKNPGFNVIIALVHHTELLQALPFSLSTEGLSGKEIGRRITSVLQEQDHLFLVADIVLKGLFDNGNPAALANRIVSQMNDDAASRSTFRKPVQYMAGAEMGLAVALVIDGRFWTDEW